MERDFIFFKKDKGFVLKKVKYNEIIYIKAMGDYCDIKFNNNQRSAIHSTLKAIVNQLPSDQFIRCHRSYAININEIHTIEDDTMYTSTGIGIPIGNDFKAEVYSKLGVISNFQTATNEI